MPVHLSHLGEDLIAAMLHALAGRGELSRVTCAITGRSLRDDVADGGFGPAVAFRADDAAVVVHADGQVCACDGEQTVDVLCTGNGPEGDGRAIAFEAKLGETRMGATVFGSGFASGVSGRGTLMPA